MRTQLSKHIFPLLSYHTERATHLQLSQCRRCGLQKDLHKPQSDQSHTALLCTVTTGDCLLDVPESTVPLPSELPGTKYSLDKQCQQIFGEEFIHCPNTSDSDVCSQLWCQEDGTMQCTTKNGSLAWADGTPCGLNGTCLRGACMPTHEVMKPLVRLRL